MTESEGVTEYEGVTIHIPAGTVLTSSKGEFLFESPLTGCSYTCHKTRYLGNGRWIAMSPTHEVNVTKTNSQNVEGEKS